MSSPTEPFVVVNLRCEQRMNPLGIDIRAPRLSWQLVGQPGLRQQAYRLLAAGDSADLTDSTKLIWDTGRIDSDQSILLPYTGPALRSRQRVYWQVQIWNQAGELATSPVAWWEMGLLDPADWQASWIAAPLVGGPRSTIPAPYLRHEFVLSQPIQSARLYSTAIGLYECWLNGERVGQDLLTPGWTDYHKRVQYQVYDITGMLREGPNAIGAILGDGWAVGHVGWDHRQQYADRARFLAQIEITLADGSQQLITSAADWRTSSGPILESDMMMGESYDARHELPGWATPGYADQAWWPVLTLPAWPALLVATNGPTVQRQEQIRPIDLREKTEQFATRWIFDLGQNMVGWVRIRVHGQAGTHLTLRYAEVLNPDGSLYTANLRSARNLDHYTLKGSQHGEEEIWEPRFTFHGFRYVEIRGRVAGLTRDSLTGIVIHSATPPIGSFTCSDPLINQLQHNIIWGQKGNFVDVPTDCPQRDERLGWTGDAQVFVETAAFNMDVSSFFQKWSQDVEDAQTAAGAYPPVAPNPVLPLVDGDGGPAWADAGVICPWMIYQRYGDTRILEQRYASMQRFVAFLHATSRDHIRCYPEYQGWHGFGDWLALDGSGRTEGGTSKEIIGTAFSAYSTRLLGKIAAVLGKQADAERYEADFLAIRAAFQQRYLTPAGLLAAQTQTPYVLALHFDLLPEALRPAAAAELARAIVANRNHLSTGFVGTPYITQVLTEAGYLDLAYTLLNQRTWPSWLYSVTQGATTIWERWDGWTHDKGFQDPGMNSFNHYAYGAIGAWLYGTVAGITPAAPGFKHIRLQPQPGGGLTSAGARLESPYGLIESTWSLNDGAFNWDVIIPANTSATLILPAGFDQSITLNGHSVTPGLVLVAPATYQADPGRYQIVAAAR
ncbi:MAG: alpha-L-rhamnosidase [Roseiflexaceae bacterium]